MQQSQQQDITSYNKEDGWLRPMVEHSAAKNENRQSGLQISWCRSKEWEQNVV